MIVLGRQLDEPVEFVGAWQDPTVARGGTRLGMAIAEKHGIKVYNLAVEKDYWDFMGLVFNGSPPEYVHVRR